MGAKCLSWARMFPVWNTLRTRHENCCRHEQVEQQAEQQAGLALDNVNSVNLLPRSRSVFTILGM